MLHSEDADVNHVIRQVIDLDKKAVRIKGNVVERAEKILDRTRMEIKEREKLEIEKLQNVAKDNYKSEIDKAKEERLSIIQMTENRIAQRHCRYDKKKDEEALKVLNELFNTVSIKK